MKYNSCFFSTVPKYLNTKHRKTVATGMLFLETAVFCNLAFARLQTFFICRKNCYFFYKINILQFFRQVSCRTAKIKLKKECFLAIIFAFTTPRRVLHQVTPDIEKSTSGVGVSQPYFYKSC